MPSVGVDGRGDHGHPRIPATREPGQVLVLDGHRGRHRSYARRPSEIAKPRPSSICRMDVRDEDRLVKVVNDGQAPGESEPLDELGTERSRLAIDEKQIESPQPEDVCGATKEAANDRRCLAQYVSPKENDGKPLRVEERRQRHLDPEPTQLRHLLFDSKSNARVRGRIQHEAEHADRFGHSNCRLAAKSAILWCGVGRRAGQESLM